MHTTIHAKISNCPGNVAKKHVYLTIDQLLALADASDWRRPIVLTLGLCGLRWG